MIEYIDGLKTILEQTSGPRGIEEIPLNLAEGRVLGRDAVSDVDLPPFNKSAMDGFAVRAEDVAETPTTLKVVMDVPAGSRPTASLGPGEAASIMTGAPVPEGADGVVQVEWTSGFGHPEVTINRSITRGKNLSPKGEILKTGAKVLSVGQRIGVEEAGLLAAVGCDPVPVYALPRVAVLSSGDEVVPASVRPGPAQIRDTNRPALLSFARSLGLDAIDLGSMKDDPEDIKRAVKGGLEYECLLISGGVSAGAYDYVQNVFEELGVRVHTRRLAVKPGKPTVFGTHKKGVVFGLPGNPVSTMVIGRVLVAPALEKMMGLPISGPRTVRARLLTDIRKKPDRLWFIYGLLGLDSEITVEPVGNRGSADLPAAAKGKCLIVAPKGVDRVEKDTIVEVVVWDRCL